FRGRAERPGAARAADLRRRLARKLMFLGIIGLSALALGCAGLIGSACAAPLDVSGTTRLPGWLTGPKARDEVAYPAHLALGEVLTRLGCHPTAAGLQWLKAGAHARSTAEVKQVATGLAAARQRSRAPEELARTLCAYVAGGFARPEQAEA